MVAMSIWYHVIAVVMMVMLVVVRGDGGDGGGGGDAGDGGGGACGGRSQDSIGTNISIDLSTYRSIYLSI